MAELRPWLDERARMVEQLALPGEFVFPANVEGGKMTKKTVYKQIRATFERAGLDMSRAGGRTLRNTFAKGQLDNGATPDELKDVLGLALERSAADYKFTRIKDDPKNEAVDHPRDVGQRPATIRHQRAAAPARRHRRRQGLCR